jgi:hypothetical protein
VGLLVNQFDERGARVGVCVERAVLDRSPAVEDADVPLASDVSRKSYQRSRASPSVNPG